MNTTDCQHLSLSEVISLIEFRAMEALEEAQKAPSRPLEARTALEGLRDILAVIRENTPREAEGEAPF